MSFQIHMKGYDEHRTFYHIDRLYAWKHNKYFPPVIVEVSPTHMCNQRCIYCYAQNRVKTYEKIKDDVLINSFKQMADAGVKAVLIQGTGEPLLHPALPEAIAAGAKRNLSIVLNTNATLLNYPLQKKILKHLFYIKFSVLESDPKRYAFLHGCPEKHWHDVVKNIKSTVKLRKKHGLKLALWATAYLFKTNFTKAYHIVKFFKELGLDYIVIQESTFTEFSPAGKKQYTSSFFSKKEISKMKSKVLSLNDKNFRVKVRFPINDETYMVGVKKDGWKNNYCHGVKFSAIISSDGEVYPCWRVWGNKKYSYGSLYKKSFEEIWKGKKRQKVEKYINNTPPTSDICTVCNNTRLNKILNDYLKFNKWRDFLVG